MENDNSTAASECPNCFKDILGKPEFCLNCDYPLEATEKEKATFMAEATMKLREKNKAPKVIREARIILFIIGFFELGAGFYIFFKNDDSLALILSLVIFLIYLLLGFWSQSKPFIALVCGMSFFLLLILLTAVLEPESIYRGIILKIVIFVLLARGINSAKALKR